MSEPYQILVRPIQTEKGTMLQEDNNQYVFEVHHKATKVDVRMAVESLFKKNVVSVRTQIVRGKVKRRGNHLGKRKNWKKAIVKLAEGQDINFYEGAV
jgi:large subunit ribosomal protein L23